MLNSQKKVVLGFVVVVVIYFMFFRSRSGYKLNPDDYSRAGRHNPAAAGYLSTNAEWSSSGASGPQKLGEFSPDKILAGQNFLDPRSQIGYPETVGGNLRNANRQERSELPNPRTPLSIWNLSTIPPDVMRPSLEIGSGEY